MEESLIQKWNKANYYVMGKNNYFKFKQFKIVQDNAAMKVGTDGILIGAWTKVSGAKTILDVGTGSGLMALMLAQRSPAKIVGIDIEDGAIKDASYNVKNSPWDNRIAIQKISLQEYVMKRNHKFDLIVSNPPFFQNDLKSASDKKNKARHTDSLPFNDLISGVKELLNEGGRFSVILPSKNANAFVEMAGQYGLTLSRLTKVQPLKEKEANRWLMEFRKEKTVLQEDCLIIYKNEKRTYSEAFIRLTREFYLAF